MPKRKTVSKPPDPAQPATPIPYPIAWCTSLNNVTLIGRVTTVPELSYSDYGVACTTFRLLIEEDPPTGHGTLPEDRLHKQPWRTRLIAAAYEREAELIVQHIERHDTLLIEGRLTNVEDELTGVMLLRVQVIVFHLLKRGTSLQPPGAEAEPELEKADSSQPEKGGAA